MYPTVHYRLRYLVMVKILIFRMKVFERKPKKYVLADVNYLENSMVKDEEQCKFSSSTTNENFRFLGIRSERMQLLVAILTIEESCDFLRINFIGYVVISYLLFTF